jgi:hypothetical protein
VNLKSVTRDETWGYILIVLGVVLLIWKPLNKIGDWLDGQTEQMITAFLFVVIGIYVWIAFFGGPKAKALALFWIVTP